MSPEIEIDARDLLCPLPILRLRKALISTAPGHILCLVATDPVAAVDVPHFCIEQGHTFLDATELPDGATAYRVRRAS